MNFNISRILLCIFCIGLAIGALDHFRGNKWKLGEHFTAGIRAFEPLFLTMAGILIMIPLFQLVLAPVIAPVFSFFGADPAIFAGTFLANDMGAFQLAHALTKNKDAADFSGMLLGSVLGVNFVFTLPAALKMLDPEDHHHLFRGMLVGFVTVPLGCLCGGLVAGYPFGWILIQIVPVILISTVSILLLWLIPRKLSAILGVLGRFIEAIALIGIVFGITMQLLNYDFGLTMFNGQIEMALDIVDSIIIVLPGAYVCIELLNRACKPVFLKIGSCMGVNDVAVLGMITSLANSIPTFQFLKRMDERGKTLNIAFLTAGAFAIGDHLAFCCALAPHLTLPLLVTKLTGAISAAALYLFASRKYYKNKK